ncbi:putative acetyltransferase, GNAT family [Thermococcus cleftensis]|uniref:Acetyltransferase, GNAT family n=1 Tax=Thermococcus cleftensis (strain DSM 27260 / KACC 17922 / CL1) TaxID=163003 RepID=I3ZV72_THECF|nr:putative acetyltransferase, GNAT family [Thermococcus cleftensis]
MREYGGEGESYAKRYLRWCWNNARDGFFVAKIGDEIVGFIVCDDDWYSKYEGRTVGAIHEFVVDKNYQGHGIGRRLMEKCLEYLGKHNDRIELWVGEKNEGAIRFYEGYGFKKVGQSGIWVRMVKDLKGGGGSALHRPSKPGEGEELEGRKLHKRRKWEAEGDDREQRRGH